MQHQRGSGEVERWNAQVPHHGCHLTHSFTCSLHMHSVYKGTITYGTAWVTQKLWWKDDGFRTCISLQYKYSWQNLTFSLQYWSETRLTPSMMQNVFLKSFINAKNTHPSQEHGLKELSARGAGPQWVPCKCGSSWGSLCHVNFFSAVKELKQPAPGDEGLIVCDISFVNYVPGMS